MHTLDVLISLHNDDVCLSLKLVCHLSCLLSCEARVQALVRFLLKALK